VRVSTLAVRTSSNPQTVARTMNFNTLAALQLRLCLPHSNYVPSSSTSILSLDGLGGGGGGHPNARGDSSSPDQRGDTMLTEARHGLVEACCQILISYRQLISKTRPPSMAEFLVPPSLDLLPLFVLSALKSPLLRPSLPRRGTGTRSAVPSPHGDERAYYLYHARRVSPSTALHLIHPLLFGVGGSAAPAESFEWHNAIESGTSAVDLMASLKSSPIVKMPPPLQATVSNLDDEGVYLLDTCFALYVVVEQDAVFDANLQSKIDNAAFQLQQWSQIGREGRCLRPLAGLPIITINKSNDAVEYQALLRWMVLDATSHERDFNTFCLDLNKRVQNGL
jgi:Sec23/Sec24 helical domain